MSETATEKFEFVTASDEPLTVQGAVFQAIGAASACWGNLAGAGVFDSTRAKAIGEALIAVLCDELLEPAWGIIANAGEADWDVDNEWRQAAIRWRDEKFHALLDERGNNHAN